VTFLESYVNNYHIQAPSFHEYCPREDRIVSIGLCRLGWMVKDLLVMSEEPALDWPI
jgi:hypothetical protein